MNKQGLKLNIVMVGPDLNVRGGISFVVKEYLSSGLEEMVDLHFIPSHRDGGNFYKIWIFIKAFFTFIFHLLKFPSAIVHLHVSQDGSFVRKLVLFIIAKFLGKKVIVHLHGGNFEEFMNKSSVHQFFTGLMFNEADRVLALSDRWVSLLSKFAQKAKFTTLYNPIKSRSVAIDQGGNFTRVICLGRLGRLKGTRDLMECIIENKEYFIKNNVHFTLAGDGEIESVREQVKENGLDKIVDVPGWILKQEKDRLLQISHVMILPSYVEQMPMSLLEGMAYGYPIISTNISGIPEMVEHNQNGFLLNPGDIKCMMAALVQLIEDRVLRERFGQRSIAIVKEKFESRLIIGKLINIYNTVNSRGIK